MTPYKTTCQREIYIKTCDRLACWYDHIHAYKDERDSQNELNYGIGNLLSVAESTGSW